MTKKIIVGVISHKPYKMPKEDIYLPIEVGAYYHEQPIFACRDNEGDNISEKNPSYCELTGFYYAYKNLDCDILGFVHYRRLFFKSGFLVTKKEKNYLSGKEIEKLLNHYDFILPKKRHYIIETNYHHYTHAHKKEAIDKTREILQRDYPECVAAFDQYMKMHSGHYFNMFIAKKETCDKYLDWLFDILFKLEKELDLSTYQGYDKRVFGFIAERLLDVYILANHLTYKNQNYKFMEPQNWPKKILKFIKRRFSKHNDTTKM